MVSVVASCHVAMAQSKLPASTPTQTPTQNPAQTPAPVVSADYQLGPEDVFVVNVLRHPEFSGEFPVPPSGMVDLPGVGPVKVEGLGLGDLSVLITNKLKTRLKRPEVSVTLKAVRASRVSVLGNVKLAGGYDYHMGWRITEAISAAGGLPDTIRTADARVSVMRAGKSVFDSSYEDAITDKDGKNFTLQPGDVVYVTSNEGLSVYVTGKVKNPSKVDLLPGHTSAVEAVLAAGGVLDDASTSNIKIVHGDGQEEVANMTPILKDGRATPLPKLQPGDLVVVPESKSRIAVLGAISAPNFYTVPEDRPIHLVDVLAKAQGTSQKAKLSKVAVVRTVGGKQERNLYDVSKYLQTGDASQNPELEAGDVVFVPQNSERTNWLSVLSGAGSAAILVNLFRR